MPILYLLCGPSRSGKSTFVKNSGFNACWVSRILYVLLFQEKMTSILQNRKKYIAIL